MQGNLFVEATRREAEARTAESKTAKSENADPRNPKRGNAEPESRPPRQVYQALAMVLPRLEDGRCNQCNKSWTDFYWNCERFILENRALNRFPVAAIDEQRRRHKALLVQLGAVECGCGYALVPGVIPEISGNTEIPPEPRPAEPPGPAPPPVREPPETNGDDDDDDDDEEEEPEDE